ncbi:MAG: hypothetical protein JSU68_13785, partial [Phycisphaerales bacterium]
MLRVMTVGLAMGFAFAAQTAAEQTFLAALERNADEIVPELERFKAKYGYDAGGLGAIDNIRRTGNLRDLKPHAVLTGLAHVFLYAPELQARVPYIDSSAMLDLLMAAIEDEDERLPGPALKLMDKHARPEDVQRFTNRLMAVAPRLGGAEFCRLLGVTDSPEVIPILEEIDARGPGYKVPDEVWARLGNREIEERLIAEFEQEPDCRAKGYKALVLGYVGTRRCAEALAAELRSPLAVRGPSDEYSLRYRLLQSLGKIYASEPLFTSELALIVARHDEYAQSGRGDDYFDRVEKWCGENLGVRYTKERPPFLLNLASNRPRPFPKDFHYVSALDLFTGSR